MNIRTAKKLIRLGWDRNEIENDLKIKSRRKGQYKIVITGDRSDDKYSLYDLANDPSLGIYMDSIAFDTPDQLDVILDAYEGLFYRLFDKNGEEMGSGMVESAVYNDWWDIIECRRECQMCFLHIKETGAMWGCMKALVHS